MLGQLDDKRWARACDEINEFEAQQRDHGTLIVKLFFHVSAEQQVERAARAPGTTRGGGICCRRRCARASASASVPSTSLHDMFAQTDTRWAPWQVIDANDKQAARIAALTAIADAAGKGDARRTAGDGETVIHFPAPEERLAAPQPG